MNKRSTERHAVWVPVMVSDEAGGRILAVSDDVSETGARLVSPAKAEVGETVELSIHFPDGTPRTVSGRVVRIEPNPHEPDGPFPYRIAVAFEDRVEGLESVLVRVEELESELG